MNHNQLQLRLLVLQATEPLSSNQNTSIASSEVKQIQLIKMLIWTNNKKK